MGKKSKNIFYYGFLRIGQFRNFEKKNFFSKKFSKFCKILENFAKLPIFEPDFHPEDDE
jgi:hypothetical protein